jgi:hypothetical protein
MADNRQNSRKWWGLVTLLAAAHFLLAITMVAYFEPFITNLRPPIYKPPWLYYAFMTIFLFPASVIFRIVRPGPDDGVFGMSVLIFTCLAWGCVWAEPFRRQYGWRPWRFTIRGLLIVTAVVAALLGLLVLME